MAIFYQVLATAFICYICATMGIMFTWPSSTLNLFTSPNTTLDRVMTETEVSLLGSISSISGLIVTPFCAYLLDALGRKRCCLLFYMGQLTAWILVNTIHKVEAVLAAMFLSGLSMCMFVVIPIFVSEYTQESIRGSMTSGVMIFYGIGMLLSYVLGGFLEYQTMNYVGLALTVLGIVLVSFMRESPVHLMTKGQEKEAARSIAFYRGVKVSSKEVDDEMAKIRRFLNPELDETPQEEKKLNPLSEEAPKEKMSILRFIKKSRSTRRAFFVCVVLYTCSILQGLVVVQVYAEPLFKQAVPSMSATLCSVIFASTSIISGFVGAYLIDLIGRRKLMILASLGTCTCCVILGSQIQLTWGPGWLTAVFMQVYCLTFVIGAGTVPFVVVAEVFLPEIKGFASTAAMEWALICNFVILFIFNPLVNALGLGPVFYLFAFVSLLSAVFSYFFLPETKGLPVDELQKKFLTRAYAD